MAQGTAERLLDWGAAARIGSGIAGSGSLSPRDRRAMDAELGEVLREADALVGDLTGLRLSGPPSRPWVMARGEWVTQNLRAFREILEPITERLMRDRLDGPTAPLRRGALAFQLGGILGYLGRKVLGQYDLFQPADDRDLLYFVGDNLVELERRFRFAPRDFRLWLSLHEVTHRFQFEGVPWMRGYLFGLIEEYLSTLELDPRKLVDALRRAYEEARSSGRWRELGIVSLLMTPEQRDTFRRMQALMSLLEGHGNFVMDRLGADHVRGAERMRRVLHERRHRAGWNRLVQRAVGVDVKVRQYDLGERFVAGVVERAGLDGFSRVWEAPENLPTLDEVPRPDRWVERVAAP
ncbi:MAG TPA: zinc-dependent metalloprotease [Actinomycetota bacterium]|nr:zinc-dependent metalloprotease [Actinomycetota bacterium]